MRIKHAFGLAIKVLKQEAKVNPGKSYTNSQGEKATIEEVITAIKRLSAWVWPDLASEELVRVTRCKNCIHFKTYRKKDDYKALPFKACSSNRNQRDPEFFCKNGEPK